MEAKLEAHHIDQLGDLQPKANRDGVVGVLDRPHPLLIPPEKVPQQGILQFGQRHKVFLSWKETRKSGNEDKRKPETHGRLVVSVTTRHLGIQGRGEEPGELRISYWSGPSMASEVHVQSEGSLLLSPIAVNHRTRLKSNSPTSPHTQTLSPFLCHCRLYFDLIPRMLHYGMSYCRSDVLTRFLHLHHFNEPPFTTALTCLKSFKKGNCCLQ